MANVKETTAEAKTIYAAVARDLLSLAAKYEDRSAGAYRLLVGMAQEANKKEAAAHHCPHRETKQKRGVVYVASGVWMCCRCGEVFAKNPNIPRRPHKRNTFKLPDYSESMGEVHGECYTPAK